MDSKPEPILSVNGDTLKMSTVKTILKSHEMFETEGIPMLVEQARQEGYKDALEAVKTWAKANNEENPEYEMFLSVDLDDSLEFIQGLDNTKGKEA